MNKTKFLHVLQVLVLFLVLVQPLDSFTIKVEASDTIYVPGDFPSIQEAIARALMMCISQGSQCITARAHSSKEKEVAYVQVMLV